MTSVVPLDSALRAIRRRAMASLIALALVCIASGCREADPVARARALQADGHGEEAVELLRQLVDERPEDGRLHLEYGRALIAIGDATRAIWPLRRAAEEDALAEEAGVLLAITLLATSNPEDAIVAASKVLERNGENARAVLARCKALLAAKREEDALADADLYVDLVPDDPQARLLQLGILVKLERIDEAEEAIAAAAPLFEELSSENPEQGARFCALDALFVWEKGDRKTGEARLEVCLTRFPDQAVVAREAAAEFDRAGEPARATSIIRKALERDPKQAEFRLMLAERLREAGDAKGAEAVLREGTSLLKGPGPWLALHDHYVVVEDYPQACKAMEQALALQPDPPSALRIAYADDLILSGDLKAAEKQAESIPAPGVHLVRGRILLARGDGAAALVELEEGIRLWPDNPAARWLAGQAAERAGDFPRAIAHYREAVRTDGSRTTAAGDLAEIYGAMGAGSDAVEFAKRDLDARPEDPEAALRLIHLSRRFGNPSGRAMGLAALSSMPGEADRLLAQQAHERALVENDAAGIALLEASGKRLGLDRLESLRVMTELELRAGRSDSAVRRISTLLRAHPDSVELLILLADVTERSGSSPASRREVLERARRAAPNDGRITVRLARVAVESGEVDAALALYDGISEGSESGAEAMLAAIELRKWAGAKSSKGVGDDATEHRLESALARDPRNPGVVLALGELLASRDVRSDRALALVRSAVLLGGGASAANALGRLLVERGDLATAVPVLESAISSFAESGPARYWLGIAHEKLGHAAEARAAFARSMESDVLTTDQRNHAESALARRSPVADQDGGPL